MKLEKLRPLLLIISLLLFGAICTLSYLAYQKMDKAISATAKLKDSHELLRGLEEAQDHMTDMERIQKNYLLTGEDSFLKEYDSIMKLIRNDTTEILGSLSRHHQKYKIDLSRIMHLIRERLQQGDSAITKTRSGDIDGAAEIMHTQRGRRLMDSLTAVERKLENTEEEDLEESQLQDKITSGYTAKWLVVSATALLLILAFFLVLIISGLKKNEAVMNQFNEELNLQVEKAQNELRENNLVLKRLNSHIQTIREEERTHIAREIHDELGQKLTAIKMGLSMIGKKYPADDPFLKESLNELIGIVRQTMLSVRKIAYDLRPPLLDELGLKATVEWQVQEYARITGLKAYTVFSVGETQFSKDLSNNVFRILQESLTNVVRHAKATELTVKLIVVNQVLELLVEDNGIGIQMNEEEKSETLGMVGMRERAESMGGSLEVDSIPNIGTTIRLRVALPGN